MRSQRASDGLVMKTMIRMRMMIPEKTLLTVDLPRGRSRRLFPGCGFVPRDVADEGGDGRVHGFVGPPGPDARGEDVVDDPVGVDVRDLVLEAVADLDADLAVLGENEEDQAVVEALAADLPRFEGPDRPVLEHGVLAERPADPDEELVARLALVILEARVEGRDRRPGQEAGLVGGPSVGGGRDPLLGRGHGRKRNESQRPGQGQEKKRAAKPG